MVKRKRSKVREVIRRALVYTHPVDTRQHLSRETWIQGKMPHPEHDIDVRLDHGVGSGHAQLSLVVDIDGKRIGWEYIDMTTLVNHWAAKMVDEELRKREKAAADTPEE
ncbi:hypothetical protein PBI_APPA_49 [Microbacterium phage Appa]|uniref:Uncharacterized protein n=1 Tax=Microbacterium phage Appa TaxID=2182350 RepID=A0A2U8UHX1_9CAUD|nr:hypothetical protein HOT26_gp65 [Microbacterium phage Appa]AWN03230.1 hypothetical protein PBI_APPA_49 [Microbacterium phage Appa]WNM67686.1 hypothetical protein SEA_DROPSHOT_49 [Microbacterium phage Dropshot]